MRNQDKITKILKEVSIWLIIYFFLFLGEIRLSHQYALWDSLMVVISLIIIFYSNNYWRKKGKANKKKYRFKTIILVIVITVLNAFIEYIAGVNHHYGIESNGDDWYTLFSFTIFTAFNFCAFLVSEYISLQREIIKNQLVISHLKEERLEAQMQMLKSKMDPHFLFNSLNAIYSMSYLKDEQTPERIMQLSELFRYITYECDSYEVPLHKELYYLKIYIDLNQLRCKYKQDVKFDLKGNFKEGGIAPMILLPFVENAYKHSHIIRERSGFINVMAYVDDENYFHFSVENSIPRHNRENLTFTSGGIGIKNVNNRLELQYPGRYTLDILSKDSVYKITLSLNLNHHE